MGDTSLIIFLIILKHHFSDTCFKRRKSS